MKKEVAGILIINISAAIVFVWLNSQALKGRLEETFVFLAAAYGAVTVAVNAAYVAAVCRK